MAFFSVVLPIFIVMSTGIVIQRWRPMDTQVLSTLLMYLFTPALMFSAIMHSNLTSDDLKLMTIFGIIFLVVSWLIGAVGSKALSLKRDGTAAVLVSIILANSANYGGSASLFAWGMDGFRAAVVFMAIHQIFASVLAIYVCARGKSDVRESIIEPFKQPIFYMTIVAAILRFIGIDAESIPQALMGPIDMLADTSIPLALVMLGMYLYGMRFQTKEFFALGFISLSRLVLIPLIMAPIAWMLGADGLVRNVLILQTAMPTAVTSLVFASEYEARPDLVGAAVIVTTIVSLLTVTVVLYLLGVT